MHAQSNTRGELPLTGAGAAAHREPPGARGVLRTRLFWELMLGNLLLVGLAVIAAIQYGGGDRGAVSAVGAAALIAALAAMAVLNARAVRPAPPRAVPSMRSEQSRVLLRAEEREKGLVADGLYARTAQTLAGVLVRLRLAESDENGDGPYTEVREALERSIDEVRDAARRLCPPELNDLGVRPALEAHARHLPARTALDVVFEGDLDGAVLDREASLALYRIAQESLTNAVRHGVPSRIQVAFTVDEHDARCYVEDDGRGFDPWLADSGLHLGLRGMQGRAASVGGSCAIEARPGSGTRVRIRIPHGGLLPGRGRTEALAPIDAPRPHIVSIVRKRPMFEHVVVPLDGSTFAETAIPLALEVAKRAGARIELVSVREPAPSTAYPEWENLAREWTGSYLERVSERFAGEGLTVTETLLFGPVAASLAEHIDEAGGDLVIMATHGRSAMTRAWLGSVADAFLRASSCPVLLVRPDDSEESAGREQVEHLEHILVPLDDSELSHAILGPVLALGELFDAHYTLVRAVIVPMELSSPYLPHTVQMNHDLLEEARATAEEMLQREAAALRERGHQVEAVVKVDGQAARVILQVAGERECGVVALATHGRGGVTRMLLGSTADKVIRGSHHPVLVIRPGGKG